MAEFKRGMAAGARAGIPFAILIGLVNTAYGKPSGGVIGVVIGGIIIGAILGAIYAAVYGHLPGAKSTLKGISLGIVVGFLPGLGWILNAEPVRGVMLWISSLVWGVLTGYLWDRNKA